MTKTLLPTLPMLTAAVFAAAQSPLAAENDCHIASHTLQ